MRGGGRGEIRDDTYETASEVRLIISRQPALTNPRAADKFLKLLCWSRPATSPGQGQAVKAGAGDGLRTRYLDLGKVALYQVSYSRSARRIDFTRPGLAGRSRRQRRPARREPAAPPISQRVHARSGLVEPSSIQAA